MTLCRRFDRLTLAVTSVLAASIVTTALTPTAQAQGAPAVVAKPGDVGARPEWKVQAKGGLVATGGNSKSTAFNLGLTASRKEGNNKLSIEGAYSYGKSSAWSPVYNDVTMQRTVDQLERKPVTSINNWISKARYDRFLTANNTAYVSGQAAADKIAGKSFYGGGQAGYSRQLVKDDHNLLVAEVGYDLSYERYVDVPGKTHDPVSVHSARVLVGETLKLTAVTGISASIEALFNLNREGAAPKVNTNQIGVDAFKDTRINGKLGLTTTLFKSLSFGFGFTLRYDQNPAPLPLPPGTSPGITFNPAFNPFAERVDTLTEATLIYTFL